MIDVEAHQPFIVSCCTPSEGKRNRKKSSTYERCLLVPFPKGRERDLELAKTRRVSASSSGGKAEPHSTRYKDNDDTEVPGGGERKTHVTKRLAQEAAGGGKTPSGDRCNIHLTRQVLGFQFSA